MFSSYHVLIALFVPSLNRSSLLSWCLITQGKLHIPLYQRGHKPLRSLTNMKKDHQELFASGEKIKHAKEFHNVISEIFDIPLEQVRQSSTLSILSQKDNCLDRPIHL